VTNGGFIINNIHNTSVVLLKGDLPSTASFRLRIGNDSTKELLTYPHRALSRSGTPTSESAVLLHPPETFLLTSNCFSRQPGHHGACLSVLYRDETEKKTTLRNYCILANVSWLTVHLQESVMLSNRCEISENPLKIKPTPSRAFQRIPILHAPTLQG
jgi:hypothetical protein